jgi:hypothetical protein
MAGFFSEMGEEKARKWTREFVAVQGPGVPPQSLTAAGPSGFSYTLHDYQYADIHATISSLKAGYVYWADGYDRWWSAFIDGKRIPIYRADSAFKAFPIPAGEHELRLVYRPVPFLIALGIYYGVFFAVLASLLAPGLRALWPESAFSGRTLPLPELN